MNTASSSAADRNRVEIHTVAEVEETTAALGENGMIRLLRKARDVAGEYGLFGIPRDHEDLLSEAFLRLLSGIAAGGRASTSSTSSPRSCARSPTTGGGSMRRRGASRSGRATCG